MSTASPSFGTLIDRLREEIANRHLTQREAAIELGVSERTLQYWLGNNEIFPQAQHRRAVIAWLNGQGE